MTPTNMSAEEAAEAKAYEKYPFSANHPCLVDPYKGERDGFIEGYLAAESSSSSKIAALEERVKELEGAATQLLKKSKPVLNWAMTEFKRLQSGYGHDEFKRDDRDDLNDFEEAKQKLKAALSNQQKP